MGYTVITPTNSFVRFDGETINHCIYGQQKMCLPVYAETDIAFQVVIEAETIEEADALCTFAYSGLTIGLVRDCEQEELDVEFDESPQRFRISPLQVLYNWPHGFPGMLGEYEIGECFYIRITVGEVTECSNCFQRIGSDCFTSVLEYGNDENFAGFNYCNGGAVEGDGEDGCEPTIIEFLNKETLQIPYTTQMKNKYGDFPSVQVWIYDESGQLVNMGISATFDAYPPTIISFDFGGAASGIITIR